MRIRHRRPVAAGFVLAALMVIAWPAAAQQQTDAAESGHRRFLDAANIVLTALESGALLADGITTEHIRHVAPDIFREADPIARPFVERGWPGQLLGGALFVSADVALRYWAHRKGHHRVERWLPMILTGYGALGAIHNARYWNDPYRDSR